MSQYTQDELDILKRCVREICDEKFFSTQHEQKKKLITFSTKESDLTMKLTKCLNDLTKVRENHCARPFTFEYRHATTQTDPMESLEEDEASSDEEPITKPRTKSNESTKSVTISLPGNFTPTITSTGSSARNAASTSTASPAGADIEMADIDARQSDGVQPKLENHSASQIRTSTGNHSRSSPPPLICIDDSD